MVARVKTHTIRLVIMQGTFRDDSFVLEGKAEPDDDGAGAKPW